MAKSNFEIAFQLGAKMDPSVKKAFGSAINQIDKVKSRMGTVLKTGAKLSVGIGAAATAIAGSSVMMANKFSQITDEIDKTSMKMGISTEAFQELRFAMGQVGVKQENLEKGMGRLNQRLADTKRNEKYRDAIQSLGVATEDASGKTRNADAVFMDSIQALHEMEDSTKQAAMAQEIFGTRTSRELMPAIQAGGDSIKTLRKEARDLGVVIGEDSVKAGVLWADTMDKAKNALGGIFNTVASKVLPGLQNFLDMGIDKLPLLQEQDFYCYEYRWQSR